MIRTFIVTVVLATTLTACSGIPFLDGGPGPDEAASLVLRGGRVFLADSALTEVSAIALRDGRVLAVGDSTDVEPHIGRTTRVIELGGRLVTPGFNDAHLHFAAGGVAMLDVVLNDAHTVEEIQGRVMDAVAEAEPGEWITGRGWDHTRLPAEALGPGGWPTHRLLDAVAPDNPVYLRRVDGHTAWVNTRAMELAGIDRLTADPQGGELVRFPDRRPTGILKENAMGLVAREIPEIDEAKLRRGIDAALELAARSGVTSVQTSADAADIRVYQRLRDADSLTVRVYAWAPLSLDNIAALRDAGITAATGDAWLRRGMLKGYVDGTLGSRTSYMLEPYTDVPSTRGILRLERPALEELVLAADAAGLQVALHAIGDAANRLTLDTYARAIAVNGARDARHRIEHAQILDAADVPRFAELGVIASMQPTHATSDMRWVEERIGRARAVEGAYAWRRLLDAGATVVFGTDFGVEPMPPVEGLYSAVTRQSREQPGSPPGGWLPEQRLSMAEAIRLYTATPAIAEFQERDKGTLEPGMLADLVVWDRDLLSIEPEAVLEARPLMTMVDGRTVYADPSLAP